MSSLSGSRVFAAELVAAGALVLVVCFGMLTFGWIGGGDAKLAAATARSASASTRSWRIC